jgi:hypothetical protein
MWFLSTYLGSSQKSESNEIISMTYGMFLFVLVSIFRNAMFGNNLIVVTFIFSISFFLCFFLELDYFFGHAYF